MTHATHSGAHGCLDNTVTPPSSPFANTLLASQVCHPLVAAVCRWVLHGDLARGQEAMFISAHPTASPKLPGDLWRKGFWVNNTARPGFVLPDLAQQVRDHWA